MFTSSCCALEIIRYPTARGVIWQVEYDAMIGGKVERVAPQFRTRKAAEAAAVKAERQELEARADLVELKAARAAEAGDLRAARLAKRLAKGVQLPMFPDQLALL